MSQMTRYFGDARYGRMEARRRAAHWAALQVTRRRSATVRRIDARRTHGWQAAVYPIRRPHDPARRRRQLLNGHIRVP